MEETDLYEEGEQTSSGGEAFLTLIMAVGFVVVVAAVLLPSFNRPCRNGGQLTACKSNLKNMGTAMEMYSTDWNGLYPVQNKAQLTPNYLKTIPECPAAGTDTYVFEMGPKATYNTQSYQEYYFVRCQGDNHGYVSVPANYPQYNGIVGLIER